MVFRWQVVANGVHGAVNSGVQQLSIEDPLAHGHSMLTMRLTCSLWFARFCISGYIVFCSFAHACRWVACPQLHQLVDACSVCRLGTGLSTQLGHHLGTSTHWSTAASHERVTTTRASAVASIEEHLDQVQTRSTVNQHVHLTMKNHIIWCQLIMRESD